jgi:pimeloyl-ACP methyl ester carboxylesterase
MNVTVAGAELNCVTRGRGPVCLVLSSVGTKPYELQLPRALDDHLTLAFVDIRGSGRSTGEAASLSFDVLADDLEAVRRALGAPRVIVLGHSIVGMLAIEYARHRPETVSHAIVVGTPPKGDMAALLAESKRYFEAHASDDRKQVLQENLANLPPGTPPSQAVFAQNADALLRSPLRRAAAVRGRRAAPRDPDASDGEAGADLGTSRPAPICARPC